jgi:AcrR family transcriptional regulator
MKHQDRKKEIIKNAATLFTNKGYSAVTMRDIAKAVGIKAASLYNHISSKQDILSDIIISLAEEFTQGMNEILNSPASSVEKLKQIIDLHITITANNQSGMASLNADWMHLESKLEYYLQLRRNYEHNFKTIIEQGIRNNEIKDGNPEVILFSILSTLRSLYIWLPRTNHISTAHLSDQLSAILLFGVVK